MMKARPHIESTAGTQDGNMMSPAGNIRARRDPLPPDAPRLELTPWGRELADHERRRINGASGQGPVPRTVL